MAIEVGNIFEGRVTGVKPFGAFVALPEGRVGMVHISEVSNEYVQDIAAVLHDGDTVKVQVINVARTARSRCPSSGCCRRHPALRVKAAAPAPTTTARGKAASAATVRAAVPRADAARHGTQRPASGSPRPRPRATT